MILGSTGQTEVINGQEDFPQKILGSTGQKEMIEDKRTSLR